MHEDSVHGLQRPEKLGCFIWELKMHNAPNMYLNYINHFEEVSLGPGAATPLQTGNKMQTLQQTQKHQLLCHITTDRVVSVQMCEHFR